jgi:hypothetical protein
VRADEKLTAFVELEAVVSLVAPIWAAGMRPASSNVFEAPGDEPVFSEKDQAINRFIVNANQSMM